MKIYLNLKRYIASNKYFWKYRHFFNWQIFVKSYGMTPKDYFDKVFLNKKIDSILDLGCATGDKLCYFLNRGSKFLYGIDINQRALNTARKKISKNGVTSNFIDKISMEDINRFLSLSNIKKFDLVVVERLFYILGHDEFMNCINILTKISNRIYIDDFFIKDSLTTNHNNRVKIGGYMHSNFDKILIKKNFKNIFNNDSPYAKVNHSFSRSALYELTN